VYHTGATRELSGRYRTACDRIDRPMPALLDAVETGYAIFADAPFHVDQRSRPP
jgi:hypothetical protein